MKIAYVTGDIMPNGNFTLFHDLLGNYPCPYPEWYHRVYLIAPQWDRGLVNHLKERYIDVRACFEDFQPSTDIWWQKIKADTEDCDVLISGNITNLDEVLPDNIDKPIVSLSMAEQGYRSPTGGYGSFYKDRFHLTAVSRSAINAFPEHVRSKVEVLYSGLDPSRLAEKHQRGKVRAEWYPGEHDLKLMLFIGTHSESKGMSKAIDCLNHLPKNWRLVVLGKPEPGSLNIPEHLSSRVSFCNPAFYVADIYLACDCLVLPTEHEGLSMSLLEAWYLKVPVVTTKHNSLQELQTNHPDVDFGSIIPVDCDSKELAEAVAKSRPSPSAQECVYQNYMASSMVRRWQDYLQKVTNHD